MGVFHRGFLGHYKRVAKLCYSLLFLLNQNTRRCLQSIVCYTFENFSTKINNSINLFLIKRKTNLQIFYPTLYTKSMQVLR